MHPANMGALPSLLNFVKWDVSLTCSDDHWNQALNPTSSSIVKHQIPQMDQSPQGPTAFHHGPTVEGILMFVVWTAQQTLPGKELGQTGTGEGVAMCQTYSMRTNVQRYSLPLCAQLCRAVATSFPWALSHCPPSCKEFILAFLFLWLHTWPIPL